MTKFLTRSLAFIALTLEAISLNAQNVGISDVSFTPNSQAILDLSAARKGFLTPRVNLNSDIDPINGTKPEGLLVYNDGGTINGSTNGFYYWDGSAWQMLPSSSSIIGGSGTLNYLAKWTPDGSNIGDSQIFDNGTSVGIGTSSPDAAYKLTAVNGNNIAKLGGSSIGLYTEVNAGSEDGIYSLHTSSANTSAYYAIGGEVQNESGIGYLGYHSSGDRSYGVYGASGTFAGYFDGNTNVSSGNVGIGTNAVASDRLVVAGGRVEFTDNTEATGTAGTGVLEIDNTLRFDGNEIITTSGTALNINYDNNSNVTIDGADNTFFTDGTNNRVGIGTYIPRSNLNVYNGAESATQTDFTQSLTNAGVVITSDYTDGTYTPGIFWSTQNNNNTLPKAGIYLRQSNLGTKMYLSTTTDYPTGLTNDGVVIDDLGNTGIGTVTPSSKLHVYDASDSRITLSRVGSPATQAVWRYNSGTMELGPLGGDGVALMTGGVGRLFITSTAPGNIGIATNTPTEQLDVNGKIRMRTGAAAGYVPVSDANGAMTWTDPSTLSTADDGDWTVSGINQYSAVSGNVGIGTTAPASKLVTVGDFTLGAPGVDNGTPSYTISTYSGASTINGGNGRELILQAGTSDNNSIRRGGHLYLRPGIPQSPATQYGSVIIADQGGNVGIGTSSPAVGLEVASTDVRISSATDAKIQLYGSSGNRGHMGWVAGSGYEIWNTDNTPIKFATTNSERMRIDAAGNVGIGGSTSAKLHITSAGTENGYIRLENSGNGRYSTIAHNGTGMLFKVSNNGDLFHWENASGTILAAINPNTQNMGVGTSGPNARLEVVGTNSDTPGSHQFRVGSNFGYRVDASTGQHLILEGNNSGTWSTGISVNRVAGNVGIGTNNNSYKLHVYGDTRFGTNANRYAYISQYGIVTAQFTDNNLIDVLDLRNNDGQAANRGTAIKFSSGDGSNSYFAGRILSGTEGVWSSTASTRDSYMSFQTALNGNNVEQMRITSSGNIGLGTSSPSAKLHVYGGNMFVTSDAGLRLGTGINSLRGYVQAVESSEYGGAGGYSGLVIATSGGEAIAFKNGGVSGTTYMVITGAGRVGINTTSPTYRLELPNIGSTDGQVRANGYATYSDERLKTNRQELAYGLDAVMQLKPMRYYQHNSEFKDGSLALSKDGVQTFGLLAQETYKVIPEMVYKPSDDATDLWSVDYSKLGPVLVKAVQEQQEQIKRLESEIEDLKKENSEIDAVKKELEELKRFIKNDITDIR